jgi:hypothetical protein
VPYIFASAAMIIRAWHIDRTGVGAAHRGSLLVALAGLTIALIGVTSAGDLPLEQRRAQLRRLLARKGG